MMFLTDEEIIELTNRHRRDKQVEVLRGMGIEHRQRPDGSIAILKSHIEKTFGGIAADNKPHKRAEPNWAAMTNAAHP